MTKIDAPVKIEAPEYAYSSGGNISFLADKPGLRGTDAQHIAIELVPDDAPLQLVGASVLITIPTQTTIGEALIVPISALSMRSDGRTQLQVEDRPGSVRTVIVVAGLSSQGFVEIKPVTGKVAVGDRVVIGSATRVSASDATAATNVSGSPATGLKQSTIPPANPSVAATRSGVVP